MSRHHFTLIRFVATMCALILSSSAWGTTPIENLRKVLNEAPKICHSLEAEVSPWRGSKDDPTTYVVPKNEVPRALDLMAVCKALPQEPSHETIVLIGKAITEHKPTAEPLVESLIESECVTQCTDIAMALANSPQAKSAKQAILGYLVKPKYPTLLTPQKHNELILHGAKKGLWKLAKEDETRLESLQQALKKSKAEFHPAPGQGLIKDARGKVIPMKHPKLLEELQAAIAFQEKQLAVSKRLK